MDVGTIGSLSTALSSAQTADAVQTSVLKKALDIEEQSAMQLIAAAGQATPKNPLHLGNKVDVFV